MVSHWIRTGENSAMCDGWSSPQLLGRHAKHTNTRGVARGRVCDVARTNHQDMYRWILTSSVLIGCLCGSCLSARLRGQAPALFGAAQPTTSCAKKSRARSLSLQPRRRKAFFWHPQVRSPRRSLRPSCHLHHSWKKRSLATHLLRATTRAI